MIELLDIQHSPPVSPIRRVQRARNVDVTRSCQAQHTLRRARRKAGTVNNQVELSFDGPLAIVELRRGPHNFFDEKSLRELGDALVDADSRPDARTVVFCSQGKNFCAGADLRGGNEQDLRRIYRAAAVLFTTRKPIVAAMQGAAVGGGLGLALVADFRVAAPDARFTANFSRLGFHQGFGLSVTLPALVGQQRALELLYTGRNVGAHEALTLGLCDRLSEGDPRDAAVSMATEIAAAAPLAVQAIRSTMRGNLAARVVAALHEETAAQIALFATHDFQEGVSASLQKTNARLQRNLMSTVRRNSCDFRAISGNACLLGPSATTSLGSPLNATSGVTGLSDVVYAALRKHLTCNAEPSVALQRS